MSSFLHFVSLLLFIPWTCNGVLGVSENEMMSLRNEVRDMFYHAYNHYMDVAFPNDELKPISCTPRRGREDRGSLDDTLGDFSLTLIDALSTLVVMGDFDEFDRALHLIIDNLTFDKDVTVSVFETTIRVLGGLLSSHLLAKEHVDKLHRPYSNELLLLAEDLGNRLLRAFETPTGLPYSRVNFKHGVLPNEVVETCTAGAGTLLIEFGVLSRLTGNPKYEEAAAKSVSQLWNARSHLDLVGNTITVNDGKWQRMTSSIGAGIDSFFEYMLKSYILFGDDKYLHIFNKSYEALNKFVMKDGWYLEVNMRTAQLTRDWIDSLQAFWPALQVLHGDIEAAKDYYEKLYSIWKVYGFIPEAFSVRANQAIKEFGGYPLRPEFIESTLFLYQATHDRFYLQVGQEIIHTLQNFTKVPCGYAAIADVDTKRLEDRMDSYFLSETMKYLYLLYDPRNPYLVGDYIFSTEGHIFPIKFHMSFNTTEVSRNVSCRAQYHKPFIRALLDSQLKQEAFEQSLFQPNYCESRGPGSNIKIEFVGLNGEAKSLYPVVVVRTKSSSSVQGEYFGTPAVIGEPFNVTGVSGKLVYVEPGDACSGIKNAKSLQGNVALIDRGTCLFLDKLRNAQNAGAAAAIICNDRTGALFTIAGDASNPTASPISIPSMLLSLEDGKSIKYHLKNMETISVEVSAKEPYLVDPKTNQMLSVVQGNLPDEITNSIMIQLKTPDSLDETQILDWITREVGKYGVLPSSEVITAIQGNIPIASIPPIPQADPSLSPSILQNHEECDFDLPSENTDLNCQVETLTDTKLDNKKPP